MKGSIGFGVDGRQLPRQGADRIGKLIDFGIRCIAPCCVAQGPVCLLQLIFERLRFTIRLCEDGKRLFSLGLGQFESPGQILDTAAGERVLKVAAPVRGLRLGKDSKEEHGDQRWNKRLHGSCLSS